MQVRKEDVLKVASLARLELSEAEVEKYTASLDQLMSYVDILKGLDLKDVEPMLSVDSSPRPLREDIILPSLSKDKTFLNAPAVDLEHFSIPKVLGQ